MGYFSTHLAHGKKFTFDSTGLPFADLKEVVDQNGMKTLQVKGVFVYAAKFGDRPAIVTPTVIINLPDHCMTDVKKIAEDDEAIKLINEGHCGFAPSTYIDKKGVERLTGTFVDI